MANRFTGHLVNVEYPVLRVSDDKGLHIPILALQGRNGVARIPDNPLR